MRERILSLATAVSGVGTEREDLLSALCDAAEAEWNARLRDGMTAADCGETFCCAVAFTAAANLAAGQSSDVASFTAGEISVKGQSGKECAARAAALRETAERMMAPYAKPVDFCFKGVQA